jgi:capsular polysaccharide biosynthesis protein
MSKKQERESEIVIDWKHLLMSILKRSWLIAIVGVISAAISFVYTSFFVVPQYSASVMLYVNNKSFSFGEGKIDISAADLAASQSLIDTYIVILNNRTTMEEIVERGDIDKSWGEVMRMISASKVEGTEVFTVKVTCDDPYEAAHIANTIAQVLPERIEEIIDGSSMRIVDTAVVNTAKVSPSLTKNVIQAVIIGAILAAAVIAVMTLIDDTVRSEDFLTENFDVPVLSRIPEFSQETTKSEYGYSYGYGQRRGE